MSVATLLSASRLGLGHRGHAPYANQHIGYGRIVLLCLLVACATRLSFLNAQGLWLDEGLSLWGSSGGTSKDVVRQMLAADVGQRVHLVYMLALYAWRKLFGEADSTLRLLSVAFGCATIPLLMGTAARLFGHRHAALSGLLAATSAYGVYFSQQARPYAFLIFLVSLLLYLHAANVTRDRVRPVDGLLFGLSAALLLAANFIAIFLLGSLLVASAVGGEDWRRWRMLWFPTAACCAPVVAVSTWLFLQDLTLAAPSALKTELPVGFHLLFVAYALVVGPTFGPPVELLHGANPLRPVFASWPSLMALFIVGCLIAASLVSRILAAMKRTRNDATLSYTYVLALGVLIVSGVLLVLVVDFNWLPRHAFYLFPLVVLILPLSVKDRPTLSVAGIGLFVLIAMNLLSLRNHYLNADHRWDDYRGVARFLNEGRSAETKSVLVGGQISALRHYGDNETLYVGDLGGDWKAHAELVKQTCGAPRVLLAVNREWDLPPAVLASVFQLYDAEDRAKFPYFSIYRLRLTSDKLKSRGDNERCRVPLR